MKRLFNRAARIAFGLLAAAIPALSPTPAHAAAQTMKIFMLPQAGDSRAEYYTTGTPSVTQAANIEITKKGTRGDNVIYSFSDRGDVDIKSIKMTYPDNSEGITISFDENCYGAIDRGQNYSFKYGLSFPTSGNITFESLNEQTLIKAIHVKGTAVSSTYYLNGSAYLPTPPTGCTWVSDNSNQNQPEFTLTFDNPANKIVMPLSNVTRPIQYITIDLEVPLAAPTLVTCTERDNSSDAFILEGVGETPYYNEGKLYHLAPTPVIALRLPDGCDEETTDYINYTPKVYYTLDGKTPDLNSTRLDSKRIVYYYRNEKILHFTLPDQEVGDETTLRVCCSAGGKAGAYLDLPVKRIATQPAAPIRFDDAVSKVRPAGSTSEFISVARAYMDQPANQKGSLSWALYSSDRGQSVVGSTPSGQLSNASTVPVWIATDKKYKPENNYDKMFNVSNDGTLVSSEETLYLHYWINASDHAPAGVSNKAVASEVRVIPVRAYNPVDVTDIADLLRRRALPAADADYIPDGKMVRFTSPLTVAGVHTTALGTSFMYVTDGTESMKLIARGTTGDNRFDTQYYGTRTAAPDAPASERKVIPAGLAGYWNENDGLFQIIVKDQGYDLRPFMPTATTATDRPYRPAETTSLTMADFNRHVELRDAVGTSHSTVIDHDGNEIDVTLRFNDITEGQPEADRPGVPYHGWGYSVATSIEEGRHYRIRGYAGNTLNTGAGAGSSARMAIFPEDISPEYPGPEAMFIGGNRIEPGEVRVINRDVKVKVYVPDAEFAALNPTFEYRTPGSDWYRLLNGDMLNFNVGDDEFKVEFRTNYGNGIYGWNTPEFRFTGYPAAPAQSIAAFKFDYLDSEGNVDPDKYTGGRESYRRMTGQAVVEQRTEYYLYLRDNIEGAGSRNHILVYNSNGWNNAPLVTDGTDSRPLMEGDVLTNFAMIPDLTPQGNLRLNATGYARTFEVVADATPQPSTITEIELAQEDEWADDPNYYKKVNLALPANRMTHFRISNVRITKRHNPQWDDLEEDADGVRHDAEGFIVDPDIYTLVMGDASDYQVGDGSLDIRFNVFTSRRAGFTTSYSPDATYTVEGVIVRDARREGNPRFSPSGYSIAMLDARLANTALQPEAVMFNGADVPEGDPFEVAHTGTITFRLAAAANPDARIYYTLDGSDPLTNTGRRLYDAAEGIQLPTDATVITLRAYAAWPGANPSPVLERTFRRRAHTVEYLRELVGPSAQEGVPYSFEGIARVVAVGGDYMFVRGRVGHYLPIHRVSESQERLSPWDAYKPGDYIASFVSQVEKVGQGAARTVRGVHVTDELAPFMGGVVEAPEQEISIEPDVVTTITQASVRRLVTLTGVTLVGEEFEVQDDAPDAADTQAIVTEWQLTENRGHGKQVYVNNRILDFDMSAAGKTEYSTSLFNVTGFVMEDHDGTLELWPTKVERIDAVKAPVVSLEGGDPTTSDGGMGLTIATFYPATSVSLAYTGRYPDRVTIYYAFTADESAPADDVKWNVYGQPFTVASDTYLHAYATVDGLEPSAHTHVQFLRAVAAGTIDFRVTPGNGQATVELVAASADVLAPYEIVYSTDGSEPSEVYSAPIVLKESATVCAAIRHDGKLGKVERAYIVVAEYKEPQEPVVPADKISGGVTYRIIEAADGSRLVELLPVDELAPGTYTIRYATEAGKVPQDIYTAPFAVPQSGIVLARLEEQGKQAGEIHTLNVWIFIPTATDAPEADGSADGVSAEAGAITAPEGSEAFDVSGRRVPLTGLRPGLYLVRLPSGLTVKVTVR